MSEQIAVPKITGSDIELGNFFYGEGGSAQQSDYEASRLLLAMVGGSPLHPEPSDAAWLEALNGLRRHTGASSYGGYHSQDHGRKYLATNGGCIYIDLNHLELASPEVTSARDYGAVWMGMLEIARQAQAQANARLPDDRRIVVLANNSDRQGHSYGGHQSFLMSRTAWDEMMRRRMLPSVFILMAYQASSIVFTGQGKVGSENGEPSVPFQISQRADFIESLVGEQTTYNRPLINTRDEALCGSGGRHAAQSSASRDRYARLHVIFYDTTLCPQTGYLKVGVMQLILCMLEAGQLGAELVLDDPLRALHEWSRDPDFNTHMPLASGRKLTAVELQMEFLERARKFADAGGFDAAVPGAEDILALWEDTLAKLHARNFTGLRGRLDWVLKRALLEQALERHTDWRWDSPELTYLDQIYSSIDPADGLFLQLLDAGCIEPVAGAADAERFAAMPPEDTRAWTRAMLLRALPAARVRRVDWDGLEVEAEEPGGPRTHIELADPAGTTRAELEPLFAAAKNPSELLEGLAAAGIAKTRAVANPVASIYSVLDGYRYDYELN